MSEQSQKRRCTNGTNVTDNDNLGINDSENNGEEYKLLNNDLIHVKHMI